MNQQPTQIHDVSGAHHCVSIPVIEGRDHDELAAEVRASVIVNRAVPPHTRLLWALGHVRLIREVTDIVNVQDGRGANPQSMLASTVHTLVEQLHNVLESIEEDLRQSTTSAPSTDAAAATGGSRKPPVRLADGLEGATVRPLDGARTDDEVLASINQTIGPVKTQMHER